MSKWLLILICVCVILALFAKAIGEEVPSVLVSVEGWESSSWGDYPNHEGHERRKLLFRMNTGKIRYAIQYSYCADKSHAPNVATPEGYIGMPEPRWENFYGNGFLYIVVNGIDIGLTKPFAIRKLEDGERGSVQIIWQHFAQIQGFCLQNSVSENCRGLFGCIQRHFDGFCEPQEFR